MRHLSFERLINNKVKYNTQQINASWETEVLFN